MNQKEPIIILSYYFYPCNLTPSERVFSFAKYLSNGNFYPIIVTRNWDIPITNSTTDAYRSSGETIKVEKFDEYEVHYLPYKSNLKDRIFLKFDGTSLYPIYLIAAFLTSLWNLFFIKFSSYSVYIKYINKLISANNKIQKMVVSASPFELFGVAYQITKKFKISWIADYRDDWSTNEMQFNNSMPKRILQSIGKHTERKWLGSARSFITVSKYYQQKLSKFLQIKGDVLLNGYLPENYQAHNIFFDEFTITYTGSIYPAQPIELAIQAFIKFIQELNIQPDKIRMIFIGIANEASIRGRIEKAIVGYERYFKLTSRIPKKEAIDIQAKSHLLLACAYSTLKGIPGSKLYEYIALRKMVLIYPTDHDIIEETLSETKQGLICKSENDFIEYIRQFYKFFDLKKNDEFIKADEIKISNYSREYQANVLIQKLNELNGKSE